MKEFAIKVMNDSAKARMELAAVHILCKGGPALGESQHIIRVLDTMFEERDDLHVGRLFISMELCDGTLADYLGTIRAAGEFVPKIKILRILIHILDGLQFCHSKNFVHRDLKPSNSIQFFVRPKSNRLVLFSHTPCRCHRSLTAAGLNDERFLLSDFGFTREIAPHRAEYSSGRWGAEAYRAPELLQNHEFSTKTDIWGIGCILMQVASSGRRFAFKDDLAAVIYANQISGGGTTPKLYIDDNPELDESFLLFLNTALSYCLNPAPEGRPTAEILYQEFVEWEIMTRRDMELEESRGRSRIRRNVKSVSPRRQSPPPTPPRRRRSQSAGPRSRPPTPAGAYTREGPAVAVPLYCREAPELGRQPTSPVVASLSSRGAPEYKSGRTRARSAPVLR